MLCEPHFPPIIPRRSAIFSRPTRGGLKAVEIASKSGVAYPYVNLEYLSCQERIGSSSSASCYFWSSESGTIPARPATGAVRWNPWRKVLRSRQPMLRPTLLRTPQPRHLQPTRPVDKTQPAVASYRVNRPVACHVLRLASAAPEFGVEGRPKPGFKIVKDFKERPLKPFKTLKKTCKNGGNPDAGA